MKKLKWTVEFSVAEGLVADGFNLTNDRAKEILANDLIFAHNSELSAKVISRTDKKIIRKLQGY